MQAIEVTMKGFGPFLEEQTFPLQGRGLVLLEGRNHDSTSALSNGAGKTAVLKAITWCQFGQYVDGDKGVEVVHRRAKKGEVRMMWVDEDSDTGYCVTRSQTKQKQSLQLEMTSGDEWVSINGDEPAPAAVEAAAPAPAPAPEPAAAPAGRRRRVAGRE
jgi:DNA repair exonuclease SbcCD ATPase subunit